MQPLRPAGELGYGPEVARLFATLAHAGSLPASEQVITTQVGDSAQGAAARWFVALQNGRISAVRYQALGCPHFLAACESLAQWLEGRGQHELDQWSWREIETALQVPAAKRGRLLLLAAAVQALAEKSR